MCVFSIKTPRVITTLPSKTDIRQLFINFGKYQKLAIKLKNKITDAIIMKASFGNGITKKIPSNATVNITTLMRQRVNVFLGMI